MIIWIKDRSTYATKAHYTPCWFDVYLRSMSNETSEIKIVTTDNISVGDYVYAKDGEDEYWGIINIVSKDDKTNVVTLKCIEMLRLFDTKAEWISDDFNAPVEWSFEYLIARYYGVSGQTYEDGIGGLQNDPMMALPFLIINKRSASEDYLYPVLDKYQCNLYDHIYKALKEMNVFIEFENARHGAEDMLRVIIERRFPKTKVIDFKDTSYTIIKEDYKNEMISSVVCWLDEGDWNWSSTTWYMKTDGTITSVMPAAADRVSGRKVYVNISSADTPQVKAQAEFDKYTYTHSIEFSTRNRLSFFDFLDMRLNGRKINGYISSVEKKSEINRYIYKSGDAATTLKQRLKEFSR